MSMIGRDTVCGINSDIWRRCVDFRDTVSFDDEKRVSSRYHCTGDVLGTVSTLEEFVRLICKKVVLSR